MASELQIMYVTVFLPTSSRHGTIDIWWVLKNKKENALKNLFGRRFGIEAFPAACLTYSLIIVSSGALPYKRAKPIDSLMEFQPQRARQFHQQMQ